MGLTLFCHSDDICDCNDGAMYPNPAAILPP
jgi:hypothetical protein